MRHLINFLCLALFSISSIQASHAIDLQPGDVVAPPPGIHIFQSSYQYAEKNDFYVKGNKKTGVPSLSSSTYFLRYGHAFQLQEKPAFFYTQTNFGALNPQGVSSDSGFGDTSFVLAVWPYANRVTQTYWGWLLISRSRQVAMIQIKLTTLEKIVIRLPFKLGINSH